MGFHMIIITIRIILVVIILIIVIIILEAGPAFSTLPFFFEYQRLVGILMFCQIVNVWPEISNTTYFFNPPVFLNFYVWLEF